MKIIENSTRRLELRLEGNGIAATAGHCIFDRDQGYARITRVAFGIIPYLKRTLPLNQVASVTVKRTSNSKTYHPTLQLSGGDNFRIVAMAKDDALAAAKTIRDFLRGRAYAD